MDLADESQRKRECLKTLEPVIHRRYMVYDFKDILEGSSSRAVQLECQQVVQAALRPFDLRTQDGLSPHVHRNEKVRVGKGSTDAVEAPDRLIGPRQQRYQRCELQRGIGRERRRQKCAVAGQLPDVAARPCRSSAEVIAHVLIQTDGVFV